MIPFIGITGNFGDKGCELAKGYYHCILEAGGSPVVIPPYTDAAALETLLGRLDGIVLSGGADMNPLLVGEEPIPQLHGINAERDVPELTLIRRAYEMQIPMLGICRGVQMLAVALGGSVYQDLGVQYADAPLVKHSQDLARERASHNVFISPDSTLGEVFSRSLLPVNALGEKMLAVNSFHHQAVRTPGCRLRVSARSSDGVIEAVESSEYKSIVGVQWHPECFLAVGDRSMMPLFSHFVREAIGFAKAKRLHTRILSLDSHCDTPMKFDTSEERLVTIPRMFDGHLDASVMVAYIPQGERTEEAHMAATAKADAILDRIEQTVLADSGKAAVARTPEELYRLKHDGRKAVMLGIENGYAIGHDLTQIPHFRSRGVVYMTLCHNGDNDICDSARKSNGEHNGVSRFGAEVIREMNRVGMMVDLSHASENSFYDALDISDVPVVCSHSSCRALCDHPRNLTDAQMKELARKGGVMQVTLYEGFLRSASGACIADAVEHINHAVDVMGIEHVGIGTDFDGDGGVPGVAHAGELINLTRQLMDRRYSENDLRLLWGENFLRVMREAQNRETSE
ncbi:MAG: membrane dipeptidase [Bacteroidaceae bacterium]|nr:membrane dipeptidase [Bacteroidaceae bacterium]